MGEVKNKNVFVKCLLSYTMHLMKVRFRRLTYVKKRGMCSYVQNTLSKPW